MIDEITTALARIRIVLVETSHSGNLGAVARAMKTMGLTRLELVAPKHAVDAEALARASGADDLLERAGIHATLPDALSGCRLVIGASARLRTVEWPLLEPPDCAQQLLAEAAHGEVALVFGRESSGLSNVELARCQALVHIPTNSDFSSLNLAAAVQVLAYEIRRTARAAHGEQHHDLPRDLATADEMESFHGHLAHTLNVIGYGDPAQSHKLMRRLRRLFHRASPDRTEINILRGILTAAEGRKQPRQPQS
ncbi:tRNA (cytosine(32)/uridine(32)-2'-O)-methyltransferase TrmJ [Chromatium weissei]|nr:tRNA (cytosine(32)/uridine(32)-2'-O)-methyltransferase TrmJ [Chromatium weissei]